MASEAQIRETLNNNPQKATSVIAAELQVTELAVCKALAPERAQVFSGDRFDLIMQTVVDWGPLTLLVNNESAILEVRGNIPPGRHSPGYFNFEHGESPIGGHIKARDIESIVFVQRSYRGLESASIQFYNRKGQAAFKLFLTRDSDRRLNPAQRERYEALRRQLQA